ncbi:hypothetical protein ZEAMMB73_Zm00001d006484 [Zea mays]|uniref:Uncharacterized protein n=1 Tax=Zea mays TaxID=4577 RepID=A0A1D6EX01_MAIZE|nr:hypothetical protein ZEAMMB73_Zm00001d006484 [Zea mays]
MYGEDARTIAELSIDDYLYPDADLYNVSGLPPLALPPLTCDLSRSKWVFDNVSVPAYREKDCTFLTKQKVTVVVSPTPSSWRAEEPGAASKLSPQAKRKVVTGLASLLPLAS